MAADTALIQCIQPGHEEGTVETDQVPGINMVDTIEAQDSSEVETTYFYDARGTKRLFDESGREMYTQVASAPYIVNILGSSQFKSSQQVKSDVVPAGWEILNDTISDGQVKSSDIVSDDVVSVGTKEACRIKVGDEWIVVECNDSEDFLEEDNHITADPKTGDGQDRNALVFYADSEYNQEENVHNVYDAHTKDHGGSHVHAEEIGDNTGSHEVANAWGGTSSELTSSESTLVSQSKGRTSMLERACLAWPPPTSMADYIISDRKDEQEIQGSSVTQSKTTSPKNGPVTLHKKGTVSISCNMCNRKIHQNISLHMNEFHPGKHIIVASRSSVKGVRSKVQTVESTEKKLYPAKTKQGSSTWYKRPSGNKMPKIDCTHCSIKPGEDLCRFNHDVAPCQTPSKSDSSFGVSSEHSFFIQSGATPLVQISENCSAQEFATGQDEKSISNNQNGNHYAKNIPQETKHGKKPREMGRKHQSSLSEGLLDKSCRAVYLPLGCNNTVFKRQCLGRRLEIPTGETEISIEIFPVESKGEYHSVLKHLACQRKEVPSCNNTISFVQKPEKVRVITSSEMEGLDSWTNQISVESERNPMSRVSSCSSDVDTREWNQRVCQSDYHSTKKSENAHITGKSLSQSEMFSSLNETAFAENRQTGFCIERMESLSEGFHTWNNSVVIENQSTTGSSEILEDKSVTLTDQISVSKNAEVESVTMCSRGCNINTVAICEYELTSSGIKLEKYSVARQSENLKERCEKVKESTSSVVLDQGSYRAVGYSDNRVEAPVSGQHDKASAEKELESCCVIQSSYCLKDEFQTWNDTIFNKKSPVNFCVIESSEGLEGKSDIWNDIIKTDSNTDNCCVNNISGSLETVHHTDKNPENCSVVKSSDDIAVQSQINTSDNLPRENEPVSFCIIESSVSLKDGDHSWNEKVSKEHQEKHSESVATCWDDMGEETAEVDKGCTSFTNTRPGSCVIECADAEEASRTSVDGYTLEIQPVNCSVAKCSEIEGKGSTVSDRIPVENSSKSTVCKVGECPKTEEANSPICNPTKGTMLIDGEHGSHGVKDCTAGIPVTKLKNRGEKSSTYRKAGRYICAICDREFVNPQGLQSHLKHCNPSKHVKHLETLCLREEAPRLAKENSKMEGPFYACTLCDQPQKFSNIVEFQSHQITHLQKVSDSSKCIVCGKRFIIKRMLELHLRRHTGLKPHKCPSCGITCYYKSDLETHMRWNCKNSAKVKKRKRDHDSECLIDLNTAITSKDLSVGKESKPLAMKCLLDSSTADDTKFLLIPKVTNLKSVPSLDLPEVPKSAPLYEQQKDQKFPNSSDGPRPDSSEKHHDLKSSPVTKQLAADSSSHPFLKHKKDSKDQKLHDVSICPTNKETRPISKLIDAHYDPMSVSVCKHFVQSSDAESPILKTSQEIFPHASRAVPESSGKGTDPPYCLSTDLESKNSVQCFGCQRRFDKVADRHLHVVQCHPELLHPCEVCGRIFAFPSAKSVHMKRHYQHNGQMQNQYECMFCTLIFFSKKMLVNHMEQVHPTESISGHHCACSSIFKVQESLKQHQNTCKRHRRFILDEKRKWVWQEQHEAKKQLRLKEEQNQILINEKKRILRQRKRCGWQKMICDIKLEHKTALTEMFGKKVLWSRAKKKALFTAKCKQEQKKTAKDGNHDNTILMSSANGHCDQSCKFISRPEGCSSARILSSQNEQHFTSSQGDKRVDQPKKINKNNYAEAFGLKNCVVLLERLKNIEEYLQVSCESENKRDGLRPRKTTNYTEGTKFSCKDQTSPAADHSQTKKRRQSTKPEMNRLSVRQTKSDEKHKEQTAVQQKSQPPREVWIIGLSDTKDPARMKKTQLITQPDKDKPVPRIIYAHEINWGMKIHPVKFLVKKLQDDSQPTGKNLGSVTQLSNSTMTAPFKVVEGLKPDKCASSTTSGVLSYFYLN